MRRREVCLASAAFLVSCSVTIGGLFSSRFPGDVNHYGDFSQKILDGGIPYDDFTVEYPPGALAPFLLPDLLPLDYRLAFKLMVVACGFAVIAIVSATLTELGATSGRRVAALAVVAASPLLLGQVFMNRYDIVAALLVSLAAFLLVQSRERASLVVLGVGFTVKLFTAAAVPVALVRLWRVGGARRALNGLAALSGTVAAVLLPFAVVAFGGLGFSFKLQLDRHLQVETLGASLVYVLDGIGLAEARTIGAPPGSIDLTGTLPDIVGLLTTVVGAAAVLLAAWLYARGPLDPVRTVTAVTATTLAFLAFAKVLSPQFLVWLVPLVPLVLTRRANMVVAAFVVALVLTQLELFGYDGLVPSWWTVVLVLVRNGLLLAMLALLLRDLAETRSVSSSAGPSGCGPAAAATRG